MVRHGLSEANVKQKQLVDLPDDIKQAIDARPDWEQRLTSVGVEQAASAGDWIRKNIGSIASFDVVYYSPFVRTRETAVAIVGNEQGVLLTAEDRIIERDWGIFGKMSREDQRKNYPRTVAEKNANPLYVRLDGGESMMDVYGRIRDMDATLHREYPEGRVLMVTHGDYMNARRYEIERMLPEDWMQLNHDKEFDFKNCSLLWYTRVNPDDPDDVRDKLHWRKFVHTSDPDRSPYNGEWVELNKPRHLTPAEVQARVESHPRLIPEEYVHKHVSTEN
jgi:broad specificity phosphatase PhoE